jgi:hypothetical protein
VRSDTAPNVSASQIKAQIESSAGDLVVKVDPLDGSADVFEPGEADLLTASVPVSVTFTVFGGRQNLSLQS